MALSTQQELSLVQDAIQALLYGGHSSYSIGGRSVSKLDLNALFAREDILLQRLERETSGGMFRGAKITRPRT
jgi:hypothetical protein